MTAPLNIGDCKDMKNNYCNIPKIKERTCFQVNNNLYRTKEAAAKKTAWSWILTKYASGVNDKLDDVKRVLDHECDCASGRAYYDGNTGEIVYPHQGCELHERKYGYFARLHKRVTRAIVTMWSKS